MQDLGDGEPSSRGLIASSPSVVLQLHRASQLAGETHASIMSASRFDITVFGATGFTGKYVCEEIVRSLNAFGPDFTWAIASRKREGLEKIREECRAWGCAESRLPGIIIADTGKEKSLVDMCLQTKCEYAPYDRSRLAASPRSQTPGSIRSPQRRRTLCIPWRASHQGDHLCFREAARARTGWRRLR